MSSRLTKGIRETICNRIISHAFKERERSLREEKQIYGKRVYEHVYPENVRQIMSQLPNNFFAHLSQINVCIDGMRLTIMLDNPVLVGVQHRSIYDFFRTTSDNQLGVDGLAILHKSTDLHNQRTDRSFEVKAILNRVSTIERLIKEWPEIEEFCKDYVGPKIALPAVRFKELNESLGLPPGTDKLEKAV